MKKFKSIYFMIALLFVIAYALESAWTTKRLTNNTGASRFPDVAASGSDVYAVWQDDTTGKTCVFFRRSDDNGATWKPARKLTNGSDGWERPAVAVSDTYAYVVYQEEISGSANNEIYFMKSVDKGETWQAAKRLTNNAGNSESPLITADGSSICVAWKDYTPGNWEIYFRRSTDGGATWKTSKRITNNAGDSYPTSIAVDGQNVFLVWGDDTPGHAEVFFRRSTDGGATWQNAKQLTNSANPTSGADIAVDNQNVFLVWSDDNPDYDIYFRRSADGGSSWQAKKKLTSNAGMSGEAEITAMGSNLYLVWDDDTGMDCTEIFFRQSADGGTTWQATKRLTYTSGCSWHPIVAANDARLFVAWDDDTPGNWDIYMKHSPL